MIDMEVLESYPEGERKIVESALATLATQGVWKRQEELVIRRRLLAFNVTGSAEDMSADIRRDQEIIKGLRAIHYVGESIQKEQSNA